jgi:Clp amino terminal domain, pathogenicity island component/Protein of unknown function (DUF3738)
MFERYNETARRSLFFSRYEASILGSLAIETEHLLLGILKERDPLITHLLGRTNLSAGEFRQLIYARIGAPASPMDKSVEIPFSTHAKQVLRYTADEAERLLHRHIGCEHLLLGLLSHEHGIAWEILKERGLALASVRDALVLHVSATSPPPPEIAGMLAGMSSRSAERSQRSADVYVLTALDGPSPGRRPTNEDAAGGGASFSTRDFSTVAHDRPEGQIHSIGPISMSGTTLSQFADLLETFLGRPVFDDTDIAGTWDIELTGQYDNPEALIAALRDQLGLGLIRGL